MRPPRPLGAPAPLDRLIFLVLLLLPSLLMIGPLLGGAIPWFMDTMMYFYPLRVQAARVVAGGEWPLWNRAMMGGVPLFENPQAALAYPLHWPSLLWPTGFWFTFPMTLQLGAYGALMAWALRRIGLGRWHAAWIGAMALAGGYGWSRLQSGNYMNVLPWLPLWLGAAHAYVATRRVRWLAAGCAAIALLLLSCAHQPAAYALAVFGLYTLVQLALARGARRRWLAYGLASLLLGAMLGAPGWLPQLGFLRETTRAGGVEVEQLARGSYATPEALLNALTGNPQQLKALPGEPWADAEDCAWVGLLVLVLAFFTPPPGPRRRAWIACLLGIVASLLLTLRPVVLALLELVPASGMFHDPRRWLVVTQWLLLVAAGLNLPELACGVPGPRRAWWRSGASWLLVLFIMLLPLLTLSMLRDRAWTAPMIAHTLLGLAAVALASLLRETPLLRGERWLALRRGLERTALALGLLLLAHATWVGVDRAMIPARQLTAPTPAPLLAGAGLAPGERFFSLDYDRAVSYDFRSPDVLAWMRPNLALLFGWEDLGGYEPAQSARYRAFVDALHAADPVRHVQRRHFGLVQTAAAASAFEEGNVRWALLPRWGEPLYFMPGPRDVWGMPAPAPGSLQPPLQLRVLALGAEQQTTLPLALVEVGQQGVNYLDLAPAVPLTTAGDWFVQASASSSSLPSAIPEPAPLAFAPGLRLSLNALPQPSLGGEWRVRLPSGARPAGVFAWDAQRTALWAPQLPAAPDALAVLARFRGNPTRLTVIDEASGAPLATGEAGAFRAEETIAANRVTLRYEAAGAPGRSLRLTLHDAWWPGWRATLDGEPIELRPAGLWREVTVPAGRHVLEFTYHAPAVRNACLIAALGGVILIAIATRARRPAAARGESHA